MSDIKPLPQTPILASDVDKTTRNAFTDVHSRVNQLIKWLGTVSQTVLPHKDTHKTGGSDALTPADIGAAPFVMGVPPGAVMAFAMSTPPDGWLECNGAAVSRTTYAALFAAIGTTFGGGDGATTFNLPDLRGEFIRGWDDGRGVDSGRAFGSWQEDEFKAHAHSPSQPGSSFIINLGSTTGDIASNTGGSGWWKGIFYTANTGGPETRPRNVALLYCIKY